MPVYEVVDPNGRKLRIEGDQPPSDMELDQIFAQLCDQGFGEGKNNKYSVQ